MLDLWSEYDRLSPEQKQINAGIPRRIRDTLSSELEDTKAMLFVKDWLSKRREDLSVWCLVLSADKGSGKSVAAGYWLSALNGSRIGNRNGNNYPAWWCASRFARLSGFDGIFDDICEHSGPVVLDDLGIEFIDKKGWFLQSIDAFVDARYSEYLPTLITTNLTATAFKHRYSERVVDRLREGGLFFEFATDSLRGE